MTYQEYFKQADFEDVWAVLSGLYIEDKRLKPQYERLVKENTPILVLLPDIRKKLIGIRMMKCATNTI